MYGIFGYVKLATKPYLILIQEASLEGKLAQGLIYRVEKLLYMPLSNDGSMDIAAEDQPFVNMIEQVQRERAFYFSYDIDLTKNF